MLRNDSVVASPLGSNTTEVHQITIIATKKSNLVLLDGNTQYFIQVYQIPDWMHSLQKDGMTISETKESHNENFWFTELWAIWMLDMQQQNKKNIHRQCSRRDTLVRLGH
jgi:hypothetical protein